jgi:hypothetical protein
MPAYYFRIQTGDHVVEDEEGRPILICKQLGRMRSWPLENYLQRLFVGERRSHPTL